MGAPDVIRSRENPALKLAGAVLAGRERELLALEGDRLVDDALAAGLGFEHVLVSAEREQRAAALEARRLPVRRVAAELLARISALSTSPGILALARAPAERRLADLSLPTDALVLVVVGIADPGNLGALARSAEAAGAAALVLVGGVSPWNEKALRGSMGSLLRLRVCRPGDAAAAAAELAALGFRQLRAATRGGTTPQRCDWSGRVAVWIGGETHALPAPASAFPGVTLPMSGHAESLNVAVAGALLLYAAGRVEARP